MKKDDLYRSQFRMPYELYEQLKAAADANKNSVNAELVARLEESFEEKAFSEGKATVLELKTLMTEISLISALLTMVQQQPQSQERDVVLKQLIDKVDAMGDIPKLFTELMKALPIEQPEQGPISFEYRPATTPTAKKPVRKGSRRLGVDPA